MAIVKTIDENEFVREFDEYNRSDNFSVKSRRELFDWYEEFSYATESGDWELDVIAICCEWGEYTRDELISEYSYLIDVEDIEREFREENLLSTLTDQNDDTSEVYFVEPLDEDWQNELDEIIVDEIFEELENNTSVIKVDDDTYLVMSF